MDLGFGFYTRATHPAHERTEVQRQWEEGRGIVLGRDLGRGLQEAELERRRVRAQETGRLGKVSRRLELAPRVDHLCPALALGLGLTGDRAPHLLGQVHVLYLDGHVEAHRD